MESLRRWIREIVAWFRTKWSKPQAQLSAQLTTVALPPTLTQVRQVKIAPLDLLKGLQFEDALEEGKLAEHIHQVLGGWMTTCLRSSGFDVGTGVLSVETLTSNSFLVHFPDGSTYPLVPKGDGTYIPQASIDGSFGPHAVTDNAAEFLREFGAIYTGVVALAHIISNADVNRKLNVLIKGQEKLFRLRESDQRDDIKSAFEYLQKVQGRSELSVQSLDDGCKTLRETRNKMISDLEDTLEALEPLFVEKTSTVAWYGKLKRFLGPKGHIKNRPGSRAFEERKRILYKLPERFRLIRLSACLEELAVLTTGDHHALPVLSDADLARLSAVVRRFEVLEREILISSDAQSITPALRMTALGATASQ